MFRRKPAPQEPLPAGADVTAGLAALDLPTRISALATEMRESTSEAREARDLLLLEHLVAAWPTDRAC